DAPLEERRTQAVYTRRAGDVSRGDDLGRLDEAAIDRVCHEAWPDARDADELHEALLLLGVMTTEDVLRSCRHAISLLETLVATRRAGQLDGTPPFWVAAERLPQIQSVYPQ